MAEHEDELSIMIRNAGLKDVKMKHLEISGDSDAMKELLAALKKIEGNNDPYHVIFYNGQLYVATGVVRGI